MPRKYTKKPVTIEAEKLDGNATEIMDWIRSLGGDSSFMLDDDGPVWVETLEGAMKANQGDWIIRGLEGEFYPCKASVFEASYEEVEN